MLEGRIEKSLRRGPTAKRRWPRIVFLLLVYGGLIVGSHWGGKWLISVVGVDISPGSGSPAHQVVMVSIALYAALMAIPFVPGMEISLALLAAFGHQVAMSIYAATVGALTASYLIGRLVPMRMIAYIFGYVGLRQARDLVRRLEPLSAEQRLETLIENAPQRIMPTLLNHRYIAIAVALNLPGNAIIGGGGGIALLAGISGLFTFPRYLAIVSLAVLPVPLLVMFAGD